MAHVRVPFPLSILTLAALSACASCGSGSGSTNPPPMALTITTASLLGGTASVEYGPATLNATGGSTPYTWSWSAQAGSTLPAGLSIKTNADNTGSIFGIPTTSGSFQVTVTVNGSAAGQTAKANLTIAIAAVSKNLTIRTTSLPIGTVSTAYGPGGAGAVLTATGGTPPYSWSWASQGGSTRVGLPSGLDISTNSDGTGLISGVPSGQGTFQVIVFVKDSAPTPVQVSANFTITIGAQLSCFTGPTTLCGAFTFLAQGATGSSTSPAMIAGSFVADGAGNITTGSLDRATTTHGLFNHLITGNFNVGPDGRGTLTINTKQMAGPVSITFSFALNSTGTYGICSNPTIRRAAATTSPVSCKRRTPRNSTLLRLLADTRWASSEAPRILPALGLSCSRRSRRVGPIVELRATALVFSSTTSLEPRLQPF